MTRGERPTLIAAFLGLCGLPAFFRLDEAQKKRDASDNGAVEDGAEPALSADDLGRALMRLSVDEQKRKDR